MLLQSDVAAAVDRAPLAGPAAVAARLLDDLKYRCCRLAHETVAKLPLLSYITTAPCHDMVYVR